MQSRTIRRVEIVPLVREYWVDLAALRQLQLRLTEDARQSRPWWTSMVARWRKSGLHGSRYGYAVVVIPETVASYVVTAAPDFTVTVDPLVNETPVAWKISIPVVA
jgi:hypothetical protein